MPGGLLNLVAYGNQNLILTGNPSKTFFKCTYAKYTNFGLQRFRLDFDGQRSLRETQPTVLRFKVPRYGDLLMDTYLVLTLPTIWSTLLPPQAPPTEYQEVLGKGPPVTQKNENVWSPYEFKWIKNLGTQLIKEVKFIVGSQVIQKFSGDYLHALVERDFSGVKKELYYKMTGNVPELNDPANAFSRNGSYPSAWPTNTPNYASLGPEPSIRGRKIYVPLNIWFTLASKMAFPLVSLQYNELQIELTLRPVQELFVIRDVESVGKNLNPKCGVSVGNYIQPNFNNQLHQMYRFLQPPPDPVSNPNATTYSSLKDMIKTDYYLDQRTNWAADIHLISTYAFLSDEEVKVFALQPQNYLIKEVFQQEIANIVGTKKIEIETSGLVSNWMWFLRRTDAFLRNEWSNYTNWAYDKIPIDLIDPLDYNDFPDNSTHFSEGNYYEELHVEFTGTIPDEDNPVQIFAGVYTLYDVNHEIDKITGKITALDKSALKYRNAGGVIMEDIVTTINSIETHDYNVYDASGWIIGEENFKLYYNEITNTYDFEVSGGDYGSGNYSLLITHANPKTLYIPPSSIAKTIPFPEICKDVSDNICDLTTENCCITWWNLQSTFNSCNLTPSYNPWILSTNSTCASAHAYPNIPYYKTNFKITGQFNAGNQKDIMLTWALIMDGKYRETELDAGVYNYVEKYVRTSGNAPDGLYCYNFGLQSSPFIFQPSGAMNVTKFRTIEFEISTYTPPSDPNAETLTVCDSDGNVVGINKPVWRIYQYTYDLVVMEERYNILKFSSGNAALAYAR